MWAFKNGKDHGNKDDIITSKEKSLFSDLWKKANTTQFYEWTAILSEQCKNVTINPSTATFHWNETELIKPNHWTQTPTTISTIFHQTDIISMFSWNHHHRTCRLAIKTKVNLLCPYTIISKSIFKSTSYKVQLFCAPLLPDVVPYSVTTLNEYKSYRIHYINP